VPVVEADLEHSVPQGLDDLALHLDLLLLVCDDVLLSWRELRSGEPAAAGGDHGLDHVN